ncbi:MAG: phosphodiester glycosidase family protein [archaeon]
MIYNLKKQIAISIASLLFLETIGTSAYTINNAKAQTNEHPKLEETIPKDTKPKETWEKLDTGLFLTQITTEKKSIFGDSKITVLKINPKNYSLNLMSASEYGGKERTAQEWAEDYGLAATINAGMFKEEDNTSNVGYMQNYSYLNNPTFKKGYNAIFAFNPKSDDVPEAQIIDTRCQNFNKLKDKYNSFSQSIRMISCDQKNTWSQQPRIWSTAALGIDKQRNILFIHSRSPYTTHDFINYLLKSHINIQNAMYLEGGPEASLYINLPDKETEMIGSYETGFNENDSNNEFWTLPNVIGIKKK